MTTQEVGAELGHQTGLDLVAHGQTRPDVIREGGQGRQIPAHRGIVFGSGVQPANHLATAFDGLLGKMVAAADPQSHVEPAQIQLGRIEIDIAEANLFRRDNFK
ncbi:hypothetical protein D3C71_1837420 [compost metagenome]